MLVMLLALLFLSTGCQQKMAQQPKLKPLGADSFFPDDRAARPLEPGTVSRGSGNHETLGDGRRRFGPERAVSPLAGIGNGPLVALVSLTVTTSPVAGYEDAFPFEVTREVLARGRQRFNIFCAPCHGQTADGHGMVVLRGFTQPPNLSTDLSRGLKYQGVKMSLRAVPPGYIVDVITRGYGAMPDYSAQVPVRDRWAIAGYVRALQLSQYAPLGLLSEKDRQALEKASTGGTK
jgi:mono/diheme cytochrome c family protein